MTADLDPSQGPLQARRCPLCQGPGPCDVDCTDAIELRCAFGDHRRCREVTGHDCPARWALPAIAAAGVEACQRTGRPWAVVCAHPDHGPERTHLLATVATLWDAKGRRNAERRRHRLGIHQQKGVVFCVDAASGQFW